MPSQRWLFPHHFMLRPEFVYTDMISVKRIDDLKTSLYLRILSNHMQINRILNKTVHLLGQKAPLDSSEHCFVFCLFPVLIQWLQPQWWKSWVEFQLWRQERWKEALQLSTHFGITIFVFFKTYFFRNSKQSCAMMRISDQALLETLCSGSSGDIRSAVNSLQFSTLTGQE